MTTTILSSGGNYVPCEPAAPDVDLASRLLSEEPRATPEQEVASDLEYLHSDRTGSAHLTEPVLCWLVEGAEDACLRKIVRDHLRICEWCCRTLRATIAFFDVPTDHPVCTLLSQSDPWFAKVQEGLNGLRELPENWDGDGAEPPNDAAINNARRVLDILQRLSFRPDRIAPSAEGGIMLSFFVGNRYGDIELFNSGEILAVTSDGVGNRPIWEVADEETAITNALERIKATINTPETPPVQAEDRPELTEKQKGLLTLLASWKEEDQTDDPDELTRRDQEITEFKNNMNRWRTEEGRGPVYP